MVKFNLPRSMVVASGHVTDTELCPKYLQNFLDGYIECALWSSMDESTPSGGVPMDRNYDPDDIGEDTQKRMMADCWAFIVDNYIDLEKYEEERPTCAQYPRGVCAGHDFWLTRNGHGVGFWDRDIDENLGCRLSQAAKDFGEFNLFIGDDGEVYGG